ncbi:hypothetical protein Tco_0404291 [Tanacetum coccineum]
MHNNIMAAGSKDRPPMLGPGRYLQMRSRFLWYIDTKPNGNPAIQQHTTIETILNMTPENKEHFLSKKEAIFLLLTGIGDDIYSTVDACKTANEMWIAIERLQQGYYNASECSILQQLQPECNEIRAERIAKSENPLALLAAAQHTQIITIKHQNLREQIQHHLHNDQVHLLDTKHRDRQTIYTSIWSISEEDSDLNTPKRDKGQSKEFGTPCKELEAHYSFMAKIQEVLPEESSSTDQPLEQRAALANLIANLTLDTEENKTILKQLKKANASLTQELEECKTNLDETSRALGEATSCQDSCLIALQNKQNELEKYIAFNDLDD